MTQMQLHHRPLNVVGNIVFTMVGANVFFEQKFFFLHLNIGLAIHKTVFCQ
jgi:hypothetical protein